MSADRIKCREYALLCAEMAQDAKSPELRQTLIEISHTWWELATQVERMDAILATDDPVQPLMPRRA